MFCKYQSSDTESLIEIFRLNIPTYFDASEEKEFIEYLSIKGETYLTILFENKIIGGVGYEVRESDKSGRINWIFLHPEFSGKGYGAKAVAHCLHLLQSDPGVEKFIVRTSQHAHKFFEKSGFTLVETEKDFWAKGLDLYLMEKSKS